MGESPTAAAATTPPAAHEDPLYMLDWSNYAQRIADGFARVLIDDEYTDVTLACEGQQIRAHKLLLSIASPFFTKLFKENKLPADRSNTIVIVCIKFEVLQWILEFIYKGKVPLRHSQFNSFMEAAKQLQIFEITDRDIQSIQFQPSSHSTSPQQPQANGTSRNLLRIYPIAATCTSSSSSNSTSNNNNYDFEEVEINNPLDSVEMIENHNYLPENEDDEEGLMEIRVVEGLQQPITVQALNEGADFEVKTEMVGRSLQEEQEQGEEDVWMHCNGVGVGGDEIHGGHDDDDGEVYIENEVLPVLYLGNDYQSTNGRVIAGPSRSREMPSTSWQAVAAAAAAGHNKGKKHSNGMPFLARVLPTSKNKLKKRKRKGKSMDQAGALGGEFKCIYCSSVYERHNRLQRHVSLCHPDTRALRCTICTNVGFSSNLAFSRHMQYQHNKFVSAAQSNPSEGRFVCVEPIHCTICNLPYRSEKSLELHMAQTHSTKSLNKIRAVAVVKSPKIIRLGNQASTASSSPPSTSLTSGPIMMNGGTSKVKIAATVKAFAKPKPNLVQASHVLKKKKKSKYWGKKRRLGNKLGAANNAKVAKNSATVAAVEAASVVPNGNTTGGTPQREFVVVQERSTSRNRTPQRELTPDRSTTSTRKTPQRELVQERTGSRSRTPKRELAPGPDRLTRKTPQRELTPGRSTRRTPQRELTPDRSARKTPQRELVQKRTASRSRTPKRDLTPPSEAPAPPIPTISNGSMRGRRKSSSGYYNEDDSIHEQVAAIDQLALANNPNSTPDGMGDSGYNTRKRGLRAASIPKVLDDF